MMIQFFIFQWLVWESFHAFAQEVRKGTHSAQPTQVKKPADERIDLSGKPKEKITAKERAAFIAALVKAGHTQKAAERMADSRFKVVAEPGEPGRNSLRLEKGKIEPMDSTKVAVPKAVPAE